ncbi:Di-copper centre-containing protein, partial [Neoconidiobolus thromboides FSU 785]
QCTKINERKEIREMSADEQQRYVRAVTTLHSESDNNRERFTDLLSRVHVYHFDTIHNSGFFLPWHRYLLRLYEQRLQNIDPSIVLPYWDWSLDYRDPAGSIVLSSQLLGGNGNRRYNYCVVNGAVSSLRPGFPSPHCLRRDYDGGRYISSLSSIEDLELLLNEDKFSKFSSQLEIIHGELHSHVGGDFKQRHSNADPLFYLHHGFMDNLFTEWLLRHPN